MLVNNYESWSVMLFDELTGEVCRSRRFMQHPLYGNRILSWYGNRVIAHVYDPESSIHSIQYFDIDSKTGDFVLHDNVDFSAPEMTFIGASPGARFLYAESDVPSSDEEGSVYLKTFERTNLGLQERSTLEIGGWGQLFSAGLDYIRFSPSGKWMLIGQWSEGHADIVKTHSIARMDPTTGLPIEPTDLVAYGLYYGDEEFLTGLAFTADESSLFLLEDTAYRQVPRARAFTLEPQVQQMKGSPFYTLLDDKGQEEFVIQWISMRDLTYLVYSNSRAAVYRFVDGKQVKLDDIVVEPSMEDSRDRTIHVTRSGRAMLSTFPKKQDGLERSHWVTYLRQADGRYHAKYDYDVDDGVMMILNDE
jgi:hypothetical protein